MTQFSKHAKKSSHGTSEDPRGWLFIRYHRLELHSIFAVTFFSIQQIQHGISPPSSHPPSEQRSAYSTVPANLLLHPHLRISHNERTTTPTPRLNSAQLPSQNHARGYRLPQLHRQVVGDLILTPSRLHAGVHDRARRLRQTKRRVRETRSQDDRPVSQRPLQPRPLDPRHQRHQQHQVAVPHHRGRGPQDRLAVRHGGPTRPAEHRREGHRIHDP